MIKEFCHLVLLPVLRYRYDSGDLGDSGDSKDLGEKVNCSIHPPTHK